MSVRVNVPARPAADVLVFTRTEVIWLILPLEEGEWST
jgi:hypothetical protein